MSDPLDFFLSEKVAEDKHEGLDPGELAATIRALLGR